MPANARAAGRIIHLHRTYAGQLHQMPLIEPHAGRTTDPLKDQVCLTLISCQRAYKTCLESRLIKQLQLQQRIRQLLWRALRQTLTVTVIIRQPIGHDRLANRVTAKTAHRSRLAVHHDRQGKAIRQGLATMKTPGLIGHTRRDLI